jgi:hypothetical protein
MVGLADGLFWCVEISQEFLAGRGANLGGYSALFKGAASMARNQLNLN